MIEAIVKNPRELSYEEIEHCADKIISDMASQNATYMQAWLILNAHSKVFKEAISHLNHNAAIEMKAQPVKYVLG